MLCPAKRIKLGRKNVVISVRTQNVVQSYGKTQSQKKPTMSGSQSNCVYPTKKCNPFENIYTILLSTTWFFYSPPIVCTSTSNISKCQQVECALLLCTHYKPSHSVTEQDILFYISLMIQSQLALNIITRIQLLKIPIIFLIILSYCVLS